MESVAETIKYFQSVSEMIKGSTLAFEKATEPFCMWSWVMKDDCPTDFMLMGFNPAFKKLVNGKAAICAPLSSLCSDEVVNFWIEKLYPITNGTPEVKVYNYYSKSYSKNFDLVVAFPAELLGHKGIALIFIENIKQGTYCKECPNNPSNHNPHLKTMNIELTVDDTVNISNCAACLKLQNFFNVQ